MIKDIDYYRNFDLVAAAKMIQDLGDDRGNNHEVFGDAIESLLTRSEEREVSVDDIVEVLGQPDRVRVGNSGEVWEYDWCGTHGPNTYTSSTHFLIADRICKGLADKD